MSHFDLCIFTKVKWPMRAQRCAERLGIWESIFGKSSNPLPWSKVMNVAERRFGCTLVLKVNLSVGFLKCFFFKGEKNGGFVFFFRL